MDVLHELQKKSDKEIKHILDNNKFIKKGAYVIHNKIIYLIDYRGKDFIVIKPSYLEISVNKVELLTYSMYRNLVENALQKVLYYNNTFESILTKQLSTVFDKDYFEVSDKIITIYFPKLIIKNSLGMEHELLDVYVKFIFSFGDTLFLSNIHLYRATYKDYELVTDYTFSHASSRCGNVHSLGSFCFGTTPISSIISKYKTNIDFRQIVPLILAFKEYLEWESIEGVPHRYLTKLKPYSIDSIYTSNFSNMVELVIKELYVNYLDSFTYTFDFNDLNGYIINISKESIKNIGECVFKIINEDINIDSSIKDDIIGYSDGQFFGKVNKIKYKGLTFQDFSFKNKKVKTSIISTKLDLKTLNLVPTINPEFMNQVINKITQDFNNFYNNFKLQ